MKKYILLALLAAVSLCKAEVETSWNKVFETGKIDDSIKWRTRISVGEADGVKFIRMGKTPDNPGKAFGFNLQAVAVEPNTLYKVVITAGVEGPDTIEDPKVVEALLVKNKQKIGKPLPGWVIMFINEKGKHFTSETPNWACFVRKGKFEYTHLFYTPAATRALAVRCNNYGNLTNVVKFYKFTLEKVDGDVRNVNPDFAPGAYNCSGYSYGGKLWRIVEENGKALLKCNDSWVMGDPIPVKAGETYTLSVTGSKFGKRSATARVLFLQPGSSLKGKGSKEVLVFGKSEFETKSCRITIPEGVSQVRTSLNRGNFAEVKLIREK